MTLVASTDLRAAPPGKSDSISPPNRPTVINPVEIKKKDEPRKEESKEDAAASLWYHSQVGTEIKIIKNASGMAQLFGWRYVHYETPNFYVGGAGYTGQMSMGAAGSFSSGGLLVGWETYLAPKGRLDISLMGGGGGGFNAAQGITTLSGGFLLEPNAAFSVILSPTVRATIDAGYVWIPSSTLYTGISAGFRFEFMIQPPRMN